MRSICLEAEVVRPSAGRDLLIEGAGLHMFLLKHLHLVLDLLKKARQVLSQTKISQEGRSPSSLAREVGEMNYV